MGGDGAIRLTATGLGCTRGGRRIFEDLSFRVSGGEALAIMGPNGAGKTSLLRIVAGLLRHDAGRLELTGGGRDLTVPEQVHYLGHQDAQKNALSVAENLTFWRRYFHGIQPNLHGVRPDSAPLSTVGLESLADLPAGVLSAGQRRRLTLARLIAVDRPIWLLDEPVAALDAAGQEKLGELMRGHLAGGGMILAATHGPLPLDNVAQLRIGTP